MTKTKTMSFAPDLLDLTLKGLKTETRRPLKGQPKHRYTSVKHVSGREFLATHPDGNIATICAKHAPGDVVPIEGTDHKIAVLAVRAERLKDITLAGVLKEGVRTVPGQPFFFLGDIEKQRFWTRDPFDALTNRWNAIYKDHFDYQMSNDPWVWTYEYRITQ